MLRFVMKALLRLLTWTEHGHTYLTASNEGVL